ncbi:TPA: helix-turn-helix domain-containing protein [Streptococcus agalactiae]|nr:helix-turn-helix domain-containing protein [Streptococcus agalactiae]
MNENQRRQIWAMRSQGQGYGTIAQAVDLPRDAVRKFCSRRPELKGYGHVVQQMIEAQGYDYCLTCGIKLDHKLLGRPKKFCSDKCRKVYWDTHREEHDKGKTAYDELTCQNCGRSFLSYANPNRKFCSHSCYIQSRFYKGGHNDQSTNYGD